MEGNRCPSSPMSSTASSARFRPTPSEQKVPVADGLIALESGRTLLIVNTTDAPISATVHREQVELSPYEVKWVTLPQWVGVLDWVEDTFTG